MRIFCFCTLFWLVLIGCDKVNSEQNHGLSNPIVMKFNGVSDTLLNDFKALAKDYKSNGVNVVIYIRLIEAIENNEFKIHLECINDQKILNNIKLDFYYFEDQFLICFDSHLSNLFSTKSSLDRTKLIELSGLKNHEMMDTKMPSWLILMREGRMIKINRSARSLFVTYAKKITRFGRNDKKLYDVDEWGYLHDDNGNIVDSIGR